MNAERTPEAYDDSPAGLAQRWQVELAAARKEVERWHEVGEKIVSRYQDERGSEDEESRARWNLFTANVQTQQSLLYGKTPKVSVSRRFADAADDAARVAGEILERLLNADVEKDGDTYAEALGYALQDRLLPGFGLVRIRYEMEDEEAPELPAVLDEETGEEAPARRKTYECVATDYVYWRDVLWSPARVWHEVRWVAFKSSLSPATCKERFPEHAPLLPYASSAPKKDKEAPPSPWDRAEVWEIWDKDTRRVFWYVEGYGEVLDVKEDPLGLAGFFPCPRPLLANAVTRKVLPRADFSLAKDLYDELDEIAARSTLLTKALAVRGVYDSTASAVKRLLAEKPENALIPVENWAMFAEKGGLKGVVDWFPLEQVVNTIQALDARRMVVQASLYEVTGMSDLLRGQAAAAGATATEQSIKARFASVRLQALQDDFARFASEVQNLKAQVVARLYDDATILEASNIMQTPDAARAAEAVALLKSRVAQYRVQVKPENVSMSDFAEMKTESMEVLGALTSFVQAMAPLAQQMPGALPHLLRMLQWTMARLKGASEVEGILDAAIEQAQQAAAQPQQQAPDTKLQAQQLKGQQEIVKIQTESAARKEELAAEVQADEIREQNQMRYNVMEHAQKTAIAAANRPPDAGSAQRGPA